MRDLKLSHLVLMILMAFMLFIPGSAEAETLKMDNNGIPIQLSRYWTCVNDTIPAQAAAVYDSLAVPENAAEAIVIGRHQALLIRPGGATGTVAATGWIYVPKDMPLKLPVMDVPYLAFKSSTGAARIEIVWLRM